MMSNRRGTAVFITWCAAAVIIGLGLSLILIYIGER